VVDDVYQLLIPCTNQR